MSMRARFRGRGRIGFPGPKSAGEVDVVIMLVALWVIPLLFQYVGTKIGHSNHKAARSLALAVRPALHPELNRPDLPNRLDAFAGEGRGDWPQAFCLLGEVIDLPEKEQEEWQRPCIEAY